MPAHDGAKLFLGQANLSGCLQTGCCHQLSIGSRGLLAPLQNRHINPIARAFAHNIDTRERKHKTLGPNWHEGTKKTPA